MAAERDLIAVNEAESMILFRPRGQRDRAAHSGEHNRNTVIEAEKKRRQIRRSGGVG